MEPPFWNLIEELLDQMAAKQQQDLLKWGRRIVPSLTKDDILQPNDFPELERDPLFRYEEGILAGILSARMAILAAKKEQV